MTKPWIPRLCSLELIPQDCPRDAPQAVTAYDSLSIGITSCLEKHVSSTCRSIHTDMILNNTTTHVAFAWHLKVVVSDKIDP